jgi:hypothetical protein
MTYMPFGRHRGEPLSALPQQYLEWLSGLPNLRPPLRGAVHAELLRRIVGGEPPPPSGRPTRAPRCDLVEELVGAGLRSLARRHHPDVGGDTRRMQEINDTADWLRAQGRGPR